MDAWLTPAGVGIVLAIVTAGLGVWWRLQFQITQAEKTLDQFKLYVAEKYASTAHLKEVEVRLITTIEKLTERIDRLIDRMDRQREER